MKRKELITGIIIGAFIMLVSYHAFVVYRIAATVSEDHAALVDLGRNFGAYVIQSIQSATSTKMK